MGMIGDEDEMGGGIVRLTVKVGRSSHETWQYIGGFADSGNFSDVVSVLESGGGGLGSVRRVDDAVMEKMVALGRYFYAYVQTVGPMADHGYHGCLAVEDDGADASVLTYTLVYDERGLDPTVRDGERIRLIQRFQDRLQAMSAYIDAAPRSHWSVSGH